MHDREKDERKYVKPITSISSNKIASIDDIW